MFPRSQRLQTSKEIISVLRQGTKGNAADFSCYFLKKPANITRVAIIIDKKVSKKAVERNLMRRRIVAILRNLNSPHGDVVVRVWKNLNPLSFTELQIHLERCLKKIS